MDVNTITAKQIGAATQRTTSDGGLSSAELDGIRAAAGQVQPGAVQVEAVGILGDSSSRAELTEEGVKRAIQKLVKEGRPGRFPPGDYKKAFKHYAGKDGKLDRNELKKALGDAGYTLLSQGTIADRLIQKFDQNDDSKLSWGEFQQGLSRKG